MNELSTLAEIQRCCKKIVDTNTDQAKYSEEKLKAGGTFHFVAEWDALAIYTNDTHYITTEHFGNNLTIWIRK